ncbi:hypothetical protein BBOV_II004710 [Babesia bovis T2Bo]|uniref:Uncharacterized protein n=1 Tax=Babesia bovis TaxID=5865 RepID=A7AU15_BABBO|nr:hypothetical protein BBOV_II004710 [Babesia bovis T2Bo]EDO06426.1 hypothetical protein BBOV_II004710 [Babesia bovis T2Bo]|eukprot:XP_001609994.1 hypothetical protein [Babesia bovis T2Bo]
MGLDEMNDTQRRLLHPLVRLKRKTSQESLGSFVELVADLSKLYMDFAQGLHQLETRAEYSCFLNGLFNANAIEALRGTRCDPSIPDEAVVDITKEQKGMSLVWKALFNVISKTRKDTADLSSLLSGSILDPLNNFISEFNEGFHEPVDELEMNDVLNFIPNLKTLKHMPGFHHSGARKYVENVLKAYKDLQHALEYEKEVVAEADGLHRGKSQAKAVNKTVKAKISLGKHIQMLFEQAPEMKILITKGVSRETIEQLALSKFKKSCAINEEVHTDPVDFHIRFCGMERKRLAMFSSCFQIFVDALVKYDRNSYENLHELYKAVVDFSPEMDYNWFEARILGTQVSEISTHTRMPEDMWLPMEFEVLEDFIPDKEPTLAEALQEAVGNNTQQDDETATVIDESDTSHESKKHLALPVPRFVRVISNAISRVSSVTSDLRQRSREPSPDSVQMEATEIHVEEVVNESRITNNPDSTIVKDSSMESQDLERIETITTPIQPGVAPGLGAVLEETVHTEENTEYQMLRSFNSYGGSGKISSHIRTSSITKLMLVDVEEKHESRLMSSVHKFYRRNRKSNRRSSSELPSYVSNLSIPLFSGRKADKRKDIPSNKAEESGAQMVISEGGTLESTVSNMNVSSNNPDTPFNAAVTIDTETIKTTRDMLEHTLKRSDEYFLGVHHQYDISLDTEYNIGMDITTLYNTPHNRYPFEIRAKPVIVNRTPTEHKTVRPSIRGIFHPATNKVVTPDIPEPIEPTSVLRLVYYLEDMNMNQRQWDMVGLETLLLLHKHLSRYLCHPCLSNDTDNQMREFLLTNLGVLENIVVRIRTLIDIMRKNLAIHQQEFDVIDALITPRDSFVTPTPNVAIHEMDLRYRLLLLIDSCRKNDISISAERLFDLPEFKAFVLRQIYLIKLGLVQKLARVIRRIPTLQGDISSKWPSAIESDNPMQMLNLKFTFADNADIELIANKILTLLCDCIGTLNVLQKVSQSNRWGIESVLDTNYRSPYDQLKEVLDSSVQIEALDHDLTELLPMVTNKPVEAPEKVDNSATAGQQDSIIDEVARITRRISARLLGKPDSGLPSINSDGSPVRNITMADANTHFCTPMEIFEDEQISVLHRINNRRGCFKKCIARRHSRMSDLQPTYVNPYFIQPLEDTPLSQCWRFEDVVIMKIAYSYHNILSDSLRHGEWPITFTTIEYVTHFMATGHLTNFYLYKSNVPDTTSICTLFHALLSINGLYKHELNSPKISSGGRTSIYSKDIAKEHFSILQVHNNISLFPKVMGELDVYLQLDVREATSKVKANYVTPKYCSMQFSSYMDATNAGDWVVATKKTLNTVQTNRAIYKVQLLLVDSICHNLKVFSKASEPSSLSLVNATSTQSLINSILLLRAATQDFRLALLEQLMNVKPADGDMNLAFKLSLYVLIDRLLYQDDLYTSFTDVGPLDTPSLLEVCQKDLNMNNVLRRIVVNQAENAISDIFSKIEQFQVSDIDELAASVIENMVTVIKEWLALSNVWDDFLPMGDFSVLFTNASIHFFKLHINKKLMRSLDVCKVMPAAHKLRLLQREIETSRIFKVQSENQNDELIKVLKFDFSHEGLTGNELMSEHSDIMVLISMAELEKRFVALKDVITRGMKNEDWVPLGSQKHTRAVVDMATVLNATVNAILSLNIPLDNLLLTITGGLEGALNHYFVCVAGAKMKDNLHQAITKLREDAIQSVIDIVANVGGPNTVDDFMVRMCNMVYLCNCLVGCQDSIVKYYHRMLTERCEDHEEVHDNLDTNLYRDSSKFFSFDIDSFRSMKELALIPASKRLIQRQCEWHMKTLAKMCTLKALLPTVSKIYQPAISRGKRAVDMLPIIRSLCSQFAELGECSNTAIHSTFKIAFRCLICRMRTARKYPQESILLREDIEALKKEAVEYKQDMNDLVAAAIELAK